MYKVFLGAIVLKLSSVRKECVSFSNFRNILVSILDIESHNYLHQGGYAFALVCWLCGWLAGLQKNYGTYLNET